MLDLSIIIPCLNEEKYISTCIESILNSDIDFKSCEIIFVDGNSRDRTVEIITTYQEKYSFIKLLHNPKKITPVSMNIGIKEARGDFIFIISAHANYPKDYFKKLYDYLIKLKADCVGGVLITDVKNKNKKSNSIKEVLSHPLGVGNASFRTGSSKIKEVDTVAFGCYTRESFKNYGLYNEKLVRNQDIELNKRIIKCGGKIYLIPDVKCTYYARENFWDLAKNNFNNGYWNILTAYYTKSLCSLSLRHFIPLLFICSVFLPVILSIFYTKILYITFFSLGSYLLFVTIISFKLKNNKNNIFNLIWGFITLHFSYGLGSFVGLFSVIKKYIKGN